MKIKVGDMVEVIRGNDRGVTGRVRIVSPKEGRVIVEGVNIIRKHQRPVPSGSRRGQIEGGIIELEAPLHISNVMLRCPSCNERTRVGHSALDSGQKARTCKKCGAVIN